MLALYCLVGRRGTTVVATFVTRHRLWSFAMLSHVHLRYVSVVFSCFATNGYHESLAIMDSEQQARLCCIYFTIGSGCAAYPNRVDMPQLAATRHRRGPAPPSSVASLALVMFAGPVADALDRLTPLPCACVIACCRASVASVCEVAVEISQ